MPGPVDGKSAATEFQREGLRHACSVLARGGAASVLEHIGREVKVVVIIGDLADNNIYTGIWELDRDGLIDALRSTLEAVESNNHATRVTIGGEVVLDRGKPS
ncbi:MAG: hypothetical protein J0H00_15855 [Burkholderiales bacterium]|nr:hypothetical protein [Burkholderiales bacterium]